MVLLDGGHVSSLLRQLVLVILRELLVALVHFYRLFIRTVFFVVRFDSGEILVVVAKLLDFLIFSLFSPFLRELLQKFEFAAAVKKASLTRRTTAGL